MLKTALFVPFSPSLAHVSRSLAVAEAWRTAGHTAIFAVGPERAAMIRAAGFAVQPLPEVAGAVFRRDLGFRWLTANYFAQNLQAEQAILDQVKPDVVALDFRFTTTAAARLAGLPSASIMHGNALRLARDPRETARQLLGDPAGVHGLATRRLRVLRRLFPAVFQAVMRRVAHRLAPVLQAHDLPPVRSPFELFLADTLLIADLPAFLPAELPPSSHVVGPLMWSGWEQPAPWLDKLDGRPLVYVTMGSTVEAQGVLAALVEALRQAPYNAVMTTGSLSLPAEGRIPPHIRVFPSVPGAAVARRSVLVVHHGGHETLMQALAAGVPSLVVPSNPDQILVGQQVQALGVGRSLRQPGDLPTGHRTLDDRTLARIRREIDDLVADHGCRRACQAIRREIEACDGPRAAAEILTRLADNAGV